MGEINFDITVEFMIIQHFTSYILCFHSVYKIEIGWVLKNDFAQKTYISLLASLDAVSTLKL